MSAPPPPPTPTFASLGIPFPLNEAPVDDATERPERGTCSLCGAGDVWCFGVTPAEVVVTCPGCRAETALESAACRECGAALDLSPGGAEAGPPRTHPLSPGGAEAGPPRTPLRACHGCLRTGRVAFMRGTEWGLVRFEDAVAGLTNGAPDVDPRGHAVETTPDGWTAVRVASEALLELVRTPGYRTWEGELWQFCCGRPMVFVGTWGREAVERLAAGADPRGWLCATVEYATEALWEELPARTSEEDALVVYGFRCAACGRHRGHYDRE